MPAFIVKSGSGSRPPGAQQQKALAANPNVRIGRPAPNNTARAPGMPSNIRVRKPDQAAMAQGAQAQAQAMQRQQPSAGLGQAQQGNLGVLRCINPGCTATVIPGVDAMTTKEGTGPYCRNCWAHTWIGHPMKNIPDGPPCNMGVRFTTPELRDIQGAIQGCTMHFAPQQRFPSAAEMDQALSGFKFSSVCANCHTDIAYTVDSRDFTIAGVNAEWPRNQPTPWMQLQQHQGQRR